MVHKANAVVEQIENEWVGAQTTGIESHTGIQRIHVLTDSLDDKIVYSWLPSLGWRLAGAQASGEMMEVMLVPDN